MRVPRTFRVVLIISAFLSSVSAACHAQAALLMEEPYGFFGVLNPTGHDAIYFARICADTPVRLRRCGPGEMGSVIARYGGILKYDWIAVPLVPYLYSVENPSEVPTRVDRETVRRLRDEYHEKHLLSLEGVGEGGFMHGGWTELVGAAYERRVYAFRFDTTEQQDDAFIARMNSSRNHTRFSLLFSNCADFSRTVLNFYFPGTFPRTIFPDAGMTTPKQITYKLERYARAHPDLHLTVYEIPQVPGNRRQSRANKGISEALITSTGYAVPIAILNPYLAGGLLVDYLARGRHHQLIPKKHPLLDADNLAQLMSPATPGQNPLSASVQDHNAISGDSDEDVRSGDYAGLKENVASHE
jgi:hypothetical protein